MRTFRLNKLVRDGIVEDMERNGQQVVSRKLSDEEHGKALVSKVVEEALEIDPTDPKGSAKELGDVLEVVEALAAHMGLSMEEIRANQAQSRQKLGGFTDKIFVETVTVQDGDTWGDYYANDPQKYPEIKE